MTTKKALQEEKIQDEIKIKNLRDVRNIYLSKAIRCIHNPIMLSKYEYWNKRIKKIDLQIFELKQKHDQL